MPPASSSSPLVFSGERLRELRERQGLDIASVARKLALSVAQLRQLEQNQSTLFYSDGIRLAAARKVSEFLGEPLLLEPIPDERPAEAVPVQVDPAAAPLRASTLRWPAKLQPAPTEVTARAAALADAEFQTHQPPRNLWGFSAWGAAMAATSVAALFVVSLPWDMSPQTSARPLSAMAQQVLASAPEPALAPAAAADMLPAQVVASAPALAPAAAAASEEAAFVPAALADGDAEKAAAGTASCDFSGPAASFSPPKAVKDGSLVYVMGTADQVVCLKDGQGRVVHHVFTGATGKSFYGTAPWLVESPQLTALQIFFQGVKVRHAQADSTRLRLVAAESAAPF